MGRFDLLHTSSSLKRALDKVFLGWGTAALTGTDWDFGTEENRSCKTQKYLYLYIWYIYLELNSPVPYLRARSAYTHLLLIIIKYRHCSLACFFSRWAFRFWLTFWYTREYLWQKKKIIKTGNAKSFSLLQFMIKKKSNKNILASPHHQRKDFCSALSLLF